MQPVESGKLRHRVKSLLQILPFLPADAALSQDVPKQTSSNIPTMGIWDPHSNPSFGHDLMSTSREWNIESECSEIGYEVISADWSEARH